MKFVFQLYNGKRVQTYKVDTIRRLIVENKIHKSDTKWKDFLDMLTFFYLIHSKVICENEKSFLKKLSNPLVKCVKETLMLDYL